MCDNHPSVHITFIIILLMFILYKFLSVWISINMFKPKSAQARNSPLNIDLYLTSSPYVYTDRGTDKQIQKQFEHFHWTKTYIPTTLGIYWVGVGNVTNPAN